MSPARRCARAHLGARRSLQAVARPEMLPDPPPESPGFTPGPFRSWAISSLFLPLMMWKAAVGSRFSRMRFPNRATRALLRTQHLALDLGTFQKPGLLPETLLSPLVYSPAQGQRSGEVSRPESQFPQVVATLFSLKRGLPLSPECYNLQAVLFLWGFG